MKAEDRWTRVGDTRGVEIQQGMKTRDLPAWFAPCFDRGYGGLPPLRFERGAFVWLVWTTTPDGDQTAARVILCPGDMLMARDDGGIDVSISDAVRRKRAEDQIRRAREEAWWAYTDRMARKSPLVKNPAYVVRCAEAALRGESSGPNTSYFRAQTEAVARQMVWC